MSAENQTELDALNSYGGPFKNRVVRELQNIPNVKVIAEEYPISLGGQRSAIDVVARVASADRICYLTMECKRAMSPYKSWIFFPQTVRNQFAICRAFRGMTDMTSGSLQTRFPDLPVCSDACAIQKKAQRAKNNTIKTTYTVNMQDIYDASIQAAIGGVGFFHERRLVYGLPTGPGITHPCIYVMPLIVTTASLSVCTTAPESVSIETGLLETLEMKPAKWLAYVFPCHPNTTNKKDDFRAKDVGSNYIAACGDNDDLIADQYKETIYVVKANHLKEFIAEQMPALLAECFDLQTYAPGVPSHNGKPATQQPQVANSLAVIKGPSGLYEGVVSHGHHHGQVSPNTN